MTWPEIDLVIGNENDKNKVKIVLLLNLSSLFHSTQYRKVTLNVGGKKHDVLWSTLVKNPKTRLGKLAMALRHEEIIHYCVKNKFKELLLVTGKGIHSKNDEDTYTSKDLGKLKYSVPEYLKTNLDLEKFIISINDAKKQDGGEGAIIIRLKNL